MATAYKCVGCAATITSWADNHYVGGSAGLGTAGDYDGAYVFCTSCWDGVEDWFLNTNIDLAVTYLCSACSAAYAGNSSAVQSIVQWYVGNTGISAN